MDEEKNAAEQIRAHAERNHSLLEALSQKGVPLEEPRSIELHFWVLGRTNAAHLGQALYKKGHVVLYLAPATVKADGTVWNVESGIRLSPYQVADAAFTADLVSMAREFAGSYDGWGTSV